MKKVIAAGSKRQLRFVHVIRYSLWIKKLRIACEELGSLFFASMKRLNFAPQVYTRLCIDLFNAWVTGACIAHRTGTKQKTDHRAGSWTMSGSGPTTPIIVTFSCRRRCPFYAVTIAQRRVVKLAIGGQLWPTLFWSNQISWKKNIYSSSISFFFTGLIEFKIQDCWVITKIYLSSAFY